MNYKDLPLTLEHRIFEKWVDMMNSSHGKIKIALFYLIAEDEIEKWYKEQEKQYPGMVMFEE